MTSSRSRRLGVIAAAATAALGLAAAVAPAATAEGTVTLDNTVPRWLDHAQPAAAPLLAAPARAMAVRVYLAPRGGLAALKAQVAAVADPASPQYRQTVRAAEYEARFAPTAQAVADVSRYLRDHGVDVTGVEGHRRYVEASADPATLGRALGTSLGTYTHDGQTVTAPATAVTLPATVGRDVLTVTGLDTTVQLKKHNSIAGDAPAQAAPATGPDLTVPPPAGFRNARPCNIDYGTLRADTKADHTSPLPQYRGETVPYVPCGYTGPQLRAAYESGTALTGKGATIAITDAYAWQLIEHDASRYAGNNGDAAYAPGQFTQSLPASYRHNKECGPSGWAGEEVLDVEAAHAMAPDAAIRYYGSRSCFDDDFADTLARVVDEDRAQIVTNSWSDLEENESSASVAMYEQVFLQGAMQGISFLFSSGDSGDELARTGVRQVDYPASDPYVTAAGGTSTAISHGQLLGQTGWGTRNLPLAPSGDHWGPSAFQYGAGGGYSALFNRPEYQTSRVPASSPAGRAVPDISMDADPNTGMLIGITQSFPEGVHYGEYRIGGTSLSSPLLAGMTALAVQQAGHGFGQLNPALYKMRSPITDVLPNGMPDLGVVRVNFNNGVDASAGLSYFVRSFDDDSSLRTTRGWDPVTGLGVPNEAFFSALAR